MRWETRIWPSFKKEIGVNGYLFQREVGAISLKDHFGDVQLFQRRVEVVIPNAKHGKWELIQEPVMLLAL